jgi:hypothetical protein
VLTAPVYFTLAPGSPTLVIAAATTADILMAPPPGFLPPVIIVPGAANGLIVGLPGCGPPACDQIDGLDSPTPIAPAVSLLSLAPGSPSLAACGFSPADVILTGIGAGCVGAIPAAALSLLPGDNIDALAVNFDGDADFVADPCDNCVALPNNDQTDTDGDVVGDPCDPCFGSPNVDTDGDGFCDTSDNCPTVANPSQANFDGDADGDACDSCPHVSGGVPVAMTAVRKVLLGYGSTGPGSGDDKPKVIKAEFTTGAAFDPDSVDNVHVTLTNTGPAGGTMFAGTMAAGAPWVQSNPAKKNWKFVAAVPIGGVKKAKLKEAPSGSTNFKFKLVGKEANIGFAPLVVATDDVRITLEIENAGLGVCFESTLTTCVNKSPAKDACDP